MARMGDPPGQGGGAATLVAEILEAFDTAIDEALFAVASELLLIAEGVIARWPPQHDPAAREAAAGSVAAARSRLN